MPMPFEDRNRTRWRGRRSRRKTRLRVGAGGPISARSRSTWAPGLNRSGDQIAGTLGQHRPGRRALEAAERGPQAVRLDVGRGIAELGGQRRR